MHDHPPPPPATSSGSDDRVSGDETETETRPLGIPVVLDEGHEPTVFTGDWVVSSPHLLPALLPSHATDAPAAAAAPAPPRTAHLIALLSSPIAFPPPRRPKPDAANGAEEPREADNDDDDDDEPDSKLLVFPPGALDARLGTCTALLVGAGTMSCPEGHCALVFSCLPPLLCRAHLSRVGR